MEFHYSDLCLPTDHLLTDPYAAEFTPQYMIPNHNAEYEVRSSVLVDGGDRFGVSAVVFDKFEELIWMGNQGGHVTSYYGPSMQKYTSFQVHESEEVRDIITVEQGIYSLTKTALRHQIRRGIPKNTYRSDNMTDMQCLYQVSTTKLLMGGHQDKLLELDLTKMKDTVIPIQEEGCAVLRSGGGSLVACGSADGMVALRDIRTPKAAEHTFRAHTACLSDLDMQGDLLITCGFTQSSGGAVAEPYVVVWDVRCLRGMNAAGGGAWSLQTRSPPLLLHFLPAFSGRAVALSADGHVALLHLNAPDTENQSVFQVDTHSSVCSVMDVSSTSQALAFGDQAGHLHLFSPQHNHEPVFNNFSRATEFADQVVGLPFANFNDTNFQYSSVPLPQLSCGPKWFNVLPEEFFKRNFRRPKPVDAEVLKTMKMQGPIGYAPNPKTFKRNQMPYVEDNFEDLNAAKLNESKYSPQPIPKHYQKVELRYNKHGPNDIDLENCNKTGFPGIEATLPNSYCNSMLQVLYYTPPVKSTLLAHTCAKEFCLSCELGFLFRMLDTSGGAACQANNFLRAFRTVPEAAALGLILPDRGPAPRADLIALIQSWNRFILHQIHYEILETRKKEKELAILTQNSSPPKARVANAKQPRSLATPHMNGQYTAEEYQYTELEFLGPSTEFEPEEFGRELREDGWQAREEGAVETEPVTNCENHELPNNRHVEREESEISHLFAIGRNQLNRCLKCNKEEERESVVLACALQYPTGAPREGGDTRGGFVELVRASLAARRSTPAWCEHCSRFTPTTQRGRIVRDFVELVRASYAGLVRALFAVHAYHAARTHRERPMEDRFTPTTQRGRIVSAGVTCGKTQYAGLVRALFAVHAYHAARTHREVATRGGFVELVRASLAARCSTPAWCEHCSQYTPTMQRGRIVRAKWKIPSCSLPSLDASGDNAPRDGGDTRGGFVELVRASLAARRSTPAWCEHCSRFTPTTQRGRIVRLPPILAINCGGPHEKAYWMKGNQKDVPEVVRRGGSSKPCRYGLHCARPGCRFKHPDRPASASASSRRSEVRDTHCVLPHRLMIRLQADGDVIINDKTEQSPTEPHTPRNKPDKHKKPVTTQSEEEYILQAAVVCVEDNPKNLVAYVQTNKEDAQWHLFNDLSIVPVSEEEVFQFGTWWKTPCVLFYSTLAARVTPPEEAVPS
ncbi:PAN2-PAN3 deadenylation complex catalytic subunit PAN2 [Ostrinia nubilalis]|uniref:PAN2-PAN3 deadenylation complex catalytic subunit PAN2 n=1 Tax=Ostrinia nubilalis TaxID=29057 RepID=UPI00308220FF